MFHCLLCAMVLGIDLAGRVAGFPVCFGACLRKGRSGTKVYEISQEVAPSKCSPQDAWRMIVRWTEMLQPSQKDLIWIWWAKAPRNFGKLSKIARQIGSH